MMTKGRNLDAGADSKRAAEKYLKICSSSLAISKIQIKTILRFHLTVVKMAKNKKVTINARDNVGKTAGSTANWSSNYGRSGESLR